MKPTFRRLREHLLHPQVKKLLNLYNKLYPYDRRTIHRIWQRNYHEFIELLDDLDYEGPFNYENLKTFIKSFDEEEKEQQKREDDELFNKLSAVKKQREQKKKQRKEYKQSIKNAATTERDFMNINFDSTPSKTENRKAYESNLFRAEDKSLFKKNVQKFVKKLKQEQNIRIDTSDNNDLKLAFAESVRAFRNNNLFNTDKKVFLVLEDLNGVRKYISFKHEGQNSSQLVDKILGEVTTESDASDSNEYINSQFIPVIFEIQFRNRVENDLGDEIDMNMYNLYDGEFWKYINLSGIDLTDFQIYSEINPKNYRDNCFVYACIVSGVFSKEEIDYLRTYVQTRKIPNKLIIEIAKTMKCNFVVRRVDENYDIKHQMRDYINTRKNQKLDFDREIILLLYKEHYMFYQDINVTTFYIKNKQKIDKDFADIPQEKRQMIRGINTKGYPIFKNEGTKPMKIFRLLFELNLFREITAYEYDLLKTCEFNNKLHDYTDLNYDESLCTREMKNTEFPNESKQIYYADFETDVTVSPHKPYLCCVVTQSQNRCFGKTFKGKNIGSQLLDYLKNNSITYFHNLKYDVCFFINTPGWKVYITERSGTVLKVVMCKYSKRDKNNRTRLLKKLIFKNSYSIIPAPLKDFASMFKLNVHKEIMAYKLYTEKNINKSLMDPLIFQLQYFHENMDKISIKNFHQDCLQLMKNINLSKSMFEGKIDIMKYAEFYCMKDCLVLMQGMIKFNTDLQKVVKSITPDQSMDINNYISISATGYALAKMYGCYEGCYELAGKPQDFISRCICGGRTMTRNNQKQVVQGKIQDFDAVSLYPSAMYIMPGIPKGRPKIIHDTSIQNVLKYDYFFIEIKINSIKCKSNTPYAFGQIFHVENGSKIFDNNPLDSFYLDKRALLDLMEFYEIDFEIVRGYYFEDGFNSKINEFISKLFELRRKYKSEHNPLQNTIKLLLNSIYGKSILKPTKTEIKCIPKKDLNKYLFRYYNYIEEVNENPDISNVFVKMLKPVNKHFNLPQFGASVLSHSKHLMNRVMCLAEQNGIQIFYQDTDSMHLFESDVHLIGKLFKEKYGQELIGESMTQFHNDFDGFDGSVGKIYSRKLIALGKKSYLDILVDEKGNEGYHIRLKGIPKQVILNHCKKSNISIEDLYMKLLSGEQIQFNLLDGSNCFRKNSTYQQTNMETFYRRVSF